MTTNVIIPTNALSGVQVSWRSSDPSVISVMGTNGMVSRPLYSNGNQFVVLQATLTKDEFTNRKDFALTVIRQDPVEGVDNLMIAEDVLAASEALAITFGAGDRAERVTTNVIIPTNALRGVQVSWSSSAPERITVTGEVTRPLYAEGNQTVVLQATLIKRGATNRKAFALTVVALAPMAGVDWRRTEGTGENRIFARPGSRAVVYNKRLLISGRPENLVGSGRAFLLSMTGHGLEFIYIVNSEIRRATPGGLTSDGMNPFFYVREYHSMVVFNEKVYIIGGDNIGAEEAATNNLALKRAADNGLNDVWSLSDTQPELVTNEDDSQLNSLRLDVDNLIPMDRDRRTNTNRFFGRARHTSVVFDEKIWVIGGSSERGPSGANAEVWWSTNGSSWTQATASPGFSARINHSSVAFGGKIWVLGGQDLNGHKNDVWSSRDGVTWENANASNHWSARNSHTAVVFQGKMWVIGGKGSGTQYKNDVWNSSDGSNWTQVTSNAAFPPREYLNSVVFDNSIWILGGEEDGEPFVDIWRSP